MQAIPDKGIRIQCHKCKQRIGFRLPEDWSFQVLGLVQLKHEPCGSVITFGREFMWRDTDEQELFEREAQEDILVEQLFQPIKDEDV